MKKILSSFLLAFTAVFTLHAQTFLIAGDIAFTGYNAFNASANRSSFSFVILRAGGISGFTTINFTDMGWTPVTNSLGATGEGTITWNSSVALAQFTEVYISTTMSGLPSASTGTVSFNGSFCLSTAGDQILAYQGSPSSPTFISGIHMNSEIAGAEGQPASTAANWDVIAAVNGPSGWVMTQNRSAIPPGLTNGVNAIMGVASPGSSNAESDNGKIVCTNSQGTSLADVRSKLNTVANWELKNDVTNPYVLPTVCTFGLGALPVLFGEIEAVVRDQVLMINWSTFEERSNDHFKIQASPDGQRFTTIGTQSSLAVKGNSDTKLNYNFSITVSQTIALSAMAAVSLLTLLSSFARRRKNLLFTCIIMVILIIPALSCNKGSDITNGDKSMRYIRIMQVDIDGTQRYSQVVKVVSG